MAKRVGIEEANRITKKATARGTDFHEAAGIFDESKTELGRLPSHDSVYVSSCQTYLDKINNVHAIERTLYSRVSWTAR